MSSKLAGIIASVALLIPLSGCDSLGGGTYSDTTTGKQRRIEATGAAAAEAARANRSMQTMGHPVVDAPAPLRSGAYRRLDTVERVARGAEDVAVGAASSAVYRWMYGVMR
jgi:hypothetical protein